MYIAIGQNTKLGGFLAALFFRADQDIVFLTEEEKEQEQIILKSETDGYFMVYPNCISKKEEVGKVELLILDLESVQEFNWKEISPRRDRIYLCMYLEPKNFIEERRYLQKYEELLCGVLREKPTMLAKLNAHLEEAESNFIIHKEDKTCEFNLEKINKIHRFDVEMIEDLMADVGLWCTRKDGA